MPTTVKSQPFVSLIIPTYNVAKYIARCLESCVNQSFNNIEIIVIDDCGTDGSIKIAEDWSKNDPRIKIIKNDMNIGTFLARKVGVEAATGENILFLDPDDTLLLSTISTLHDQMVKSPVDILFFNFIEQSKDTTKKITKKLPRETYNRIDVIKNIFIDINNPPWGIAGKLYVARIAKKAYDNFAHFKERLTYSEDVLFLYAAALSAESCRSINNYLYVYFKNEESITEHISKHDLLWKLNQSELSIKCLQEALAQVELNNPYRKASLARTIANIRSSMFKLTRHCPDFYENKNSYVYALTQSFYNKKDWKDFARLAVYCLTLSRLKP